MIADETMKHMLEVARFMYNHADLIYDNPTEEQKRDLFTLGFVHDIGKEFEKKDKEYHGLVGAKMLRRLGYAFSDEVSEHGFEYDTTPELWLLNYADWCIASDGTEMTPRLRLKNIYKCHTGRSKAYRHAKEFFQNFINDERINTETKAQNKL